jgi:indolepyruvate ferredoxin oxidoreductase
MTVVSRAAAAEQAVDPKADGFASAVAESLFRLMAYKDEYEVARLYADGAFKARLAEQFEGDFKLKFSLAPPLFARTDPATGLPRKHLFGGWMAFAFKGLARLRGLRGTAFDPFGGLADRKLERALIGEFETLVSELCTSLDSSNLETATTLARSPQAIKGFGHVKAASLAKVRAQQSDLLLKFRTAPTALRSAS